MAEHGIDDIVKKVHFDRSAIKAVHSSNPVKDNEAWISYDTEKILPKYDPSKSYPTYAIYWMRPLDQLGSEVENVAKSFNLGLSLLKFDKYDEAVKSFDKALEIDPMNAAAWYNRGLAFVSLEKYDEAVKSFDKALEIDPMNAAAWYDKAVALDRLHKYAEAVMCFNKAKEVSSNSAAWYNKRTGSEEILSEVLLNNASMFGGILTIDKNISPKSVAEPIILAPVDLPLPTGHSKYLESNRVRSIHPIVSDALANLLNDQRTEVRAIGTGRDDRITKPTLLYQVEDQHHLYKGDRALETNLSPARPQEAVTAIKLDRYPLARFPKEITIGETAPLDIIIKATRESAAYFAEPIQIRTVTGEKEVKILAIVQRNEGFEIVDNKFFSHIKVPTEPKDSDSAIFLLKAIKEGSFDIKIDFYQDRNPIGHLVLNSKVTPNQLEIRPKYLITNIEPPLLNIGNNPPAADIVLQIIKGGKNQNGSQYYVQIQRRDTAYPERFNDMTLPSEVVSDFLKMFEDIENNGLAQNMVDNRMKSKGLILYDYIFAPDLKDTYWQIKDRINSFQVLSDEPWIPWEILKPNRRSGGVIEDEDEFLAERYSFARWDLGDAKEHFPFRLKNRIKKIVLVIPGNSPYDKSYTEVIEGFKDSAGFELKTISTYTQVKDVLKGKDFDLLHISTHGEYNDKSALYSPIKLKGSDLRPDDIYPEHFGEANPVVILDSCKSGRQSFFFNQLEGWITAFQRAGASSIISTLWSVSEKAAFDFISELYNQLSKGDLMLGEAVHKARLNCKRNGDPSWLAYVLYGHPNAQITIK